MTLPKAISEPMSAPIGVMIDGIAEGLMEQTITAASATNVPPRQIGLSGTAPRTGFVPQQPPRSSYGARRNGSDCLRRVHLALARGISYRC